MPESAAPLPLWLWSHPIRSAPKAHPNHGWRACTENPPVVEEVIDPEPVKAQPEA